MDAMHFRILAGFIQMTLACGVAYRLGDRPVRQAAVLIAACWVLATAGELLSHGAIEWVIAADILGGLGVLAIAWKEGRGWTWIMLIVQSILLVLHAVLYEAHQAPNRLEIFGNNILASTVLVVLLAAALLSWRRPRA